MPTIRDVAREAGVSIATVSYVLNNKIELVGAETRREVLEAAERIGYRPNATARNLRSNRTRLIGYAWYEAPTYSASSGRLNTVLDLFTFYLARAAEQSGHHLLTFTYPPDNPASVYGEFVESERVDAFVLAGTVANDERVRFLLDRHFPFVSFGRSNADWDFPWVDTDNRYGVEQAVEYLIQLGHRRIAMLAWPEGSLTGSFRLQGFLDAMRHAGLSVPEGYVLRGVHAVETGVDAMRRWFELPVAERPSAVIAVSDLMAIGLMHEAQRLGLEVGRDISVVGYDDMPMTEYLRPPLTTVQQPIPEIGHTLIQILDSILNHRRDEARQVLLLPRLIVRDSCGPPLV